MEISWGCFFHRWSAWMEANQTEADGQMEVIVTDESEDVIYCGELCHIYWMMSSSKCEGSIPNARDTHPELGWYNTTSTQVPSHRSSKAYDWELPYASLDTACRSCTTTQTLWQTLAAIHVHDHLPWYSHVSHSWTDSVRSNGTSWTYGSSGGGGGVVATSWVAA